MRKACELAGRACPAVPPPGQDHSFDENLKHDTWRDPLLLLMAAVCGVDANVRHALTLSRRELAFNVAVRERDRLRDSVDERSAKRVLAHLYGCVTLCDGLTRDEALTVAANECAALGVAYPGTAVENLADWLGAKDRLPPLKPDLLGEALLLALFGESGILPPQVIQRLAPMASDRMAVVLIRLVQDFGYLPPEEPKESQRASWARQSLLWVKALVDAGESDIGVLINVHYSLPQSTLSLRSLAVEVTSALVDRLRGTDYANTTEGRSLLADWLNDSSLRQSDMGQREAALRSIDEAVTIRRELVESNREAFLPNLAMSLNNLSNQQSDMGMREAALRSIEEAVTIRRELVQSSREAFLPGLASSLNNLSVQQSYMGMREAALRSIEEAVTHYRELVQSSREAFLPDLAMSLNNLSNRQSNMGMREAALRSIEEAVTIRRELVQSSREAFLPDLAMSLSVLGDRLAEMNKLPEARGAAAESLLLLGSFSQRYPGTLDGLARATVRDYVLRSQELGLELEAEVLEPYVSLIQHEQQADTGGEA